MKKFFLIAATGLLTLSALAQPQLRSDNIDEVLKAMTLEEKATLLVGGARAVIVDGVPTGTTLARSTASASPVPSSPTVLPASVSALRATALRRLSIAPVSRWALCSPAPGTSTLSRP